MFCCSLGYQESMELWPQTSTWHQQPLQSQVRQLPVYLFTLDTFCTKTRCSRPKCSLSWIYTSWKWYHTIFYVLTQEFKKKMHFNFGPMRTESWPNHPWGRYLRTEGLRKSRESERLRHPVHELVAFTTETEPPNWYLRLPCFPGPASAPFFYFPLTL